MIKEYLKIKNEEFKDIFYISLSLGFMFSLAYFRMTDLPMPFPMAFLSFTLFLLILLLTRNIFMKFIAYNNGFSITQYLTKFDRYGFRNFDRISYYAKKNTVKLGIKNPIRNRGSGKVPMTILSLMIYVLTLGIIIIPSMWRYKVEKIPHKFLGSRSKFDQSILYYMVPSEITNYRYSKTLFGGYLYYLIFAWFLKSISNVWQSDLVYWFIYVIFWIAFVTIIPMIGTEGFDLFKKGKIGWICTNVMLFLGLLTLLIFNRLDYIIITTVVSFVILFVYMFYKEMILK